MKGPDIVALAATILGFFALVLEFILSRRRESTHAREIGEILGDHGARIESLEAWRHW